MSRVTRSGEGADGGGVKLIRMERERFARVVERTRLGESARRMAERVLVDGWSMRQASAEAGLSSTRASVAVQRVRRAHAASGEALEGGGWSRVDVPVELAEAIAEFVEAMQRPEVSLAKRARLIREAIAALREMPGSGRPGAGASGLGPHETRALRPKRRRVR